MIPVLEVKPMVPSFPQESKTSKRTGANSFENGDLLFVSETVDFMFSSKDISASQRLKCSLDIFFLLRILLRNSVVAAVEVCLV